jgi:hypothetical protein
VTFRFHGQRKDGSTFDGEMDMIPLTYGGHTFAYHLPGRHRIALQSARKGLSPCPRAGESQRVQEVARLLMAATIQAVPSSRSAAASR